MDRFLKAFGDPTRRRIFGFLQSQPESPQTVDEVATAQGLHRTVAFGHLELLAQLEFLTRGVRPGLRGRPARTYRVVGPAGEVSNPPRQHRLLATLLAGVLARGNGSGIADAKLAGEAYGRQLAAGSSTDAQVLARLGALDAHYETTGDRVYARNCIFREACSSAPKVVCGLQAGILEGALRVAGPDRIVVPEGPDFSGGCAYRIQAGSLPAEPEGG